MTPWTCSRTVGGAGSASTAIPCQDECTPKMWKRDIASAFRCLPIQGDQLDLSFVVFVVNLVVWIAHHVAMPFGTTSAVHAWHRVGSLMCAIVRRFFRAPSAKFVDDFFGASASGIRLTGGHCLDVLGEILGFPTKDVKSVSLAETMHILGAILLFVPRTLELRIAVDPEKAARWSKPWHRLWPQESARRGLP